MYAIKIRLKVIMLLLNVNTVIYDCNNYYVSVYKLCVSFYVDDYVEIEIPSSREKKNSTHRSPMSYT